MVTATDVGSATAERLRAVLRAYQIDSRRAEAVPLGGGHIHRTWSVTTADAEGYVVQELNAQVFRDLSACEENLRRIDDLFHLGNRHREITIPKHLRTLTDGLHALLPDGSAWRATHRVEGTIAPQEVATADVAGVVARAFGGFATTLRSLPGGPLRETIPRFHDFGWRVDQLHEACMADRLGRATTVHRELSDADTLADRLREPARSIAANATHAVHNDAKVMNLLCDRTTGAARAVVDLDTTMPGSALVDLGELIRSAASDCAEDARNLEVMDVRRSVVDALIDSFREAYEFSTTEVSLIHYAGPVLAVENGMRFLADHLNGDAYFRVERPGQNLDRARMQFRLAVELLRT